MFPVLFHVGILKIYTFGIFLVLGFFAAAFLLWKNIKLTSYKEEEIFDGLFLSILGGLLGGRIIYVALNFGDFGFNFLRFLLINGYPGLSLFGALFGAFITLTLYARAKKIGLLDVCEYAVSPLFLALAISKIGSFLGGNDVGMQTKFLLNARYAGLDGTRHIVAVYEALLFFIAFVISYRLLFIVRRERAKMGTSLFLFMTLFGFTELILDNLKQNHLYLAGLSFNTVAAIIFFIVGTVFLLITYREEIGKKFHGTKRTHTSTDRTTQKNAPEGGDTHSSDN